MSDALEEHDGKVSIGGRNITNLRFADDIDALAEEEQELEALVERGWSGGAMVLGKLPVPGRLTSLDKSRARAYCSCSRCGWGLCGHFYSHLSFLSSFSLSLGDDPI